MVRLPCAAFFGTLKFVGAVVPADLPLNEWPMIEAHDSASGYLPGGALHVVNQWTITQPSDTKAAVGKQLGCGARAFDWRPKVSNDGSLIMHHGSVDVNHAMADAVQEMVAWAAENTDDADFILLAVTDCEGDKCKELAQQVLSDAGVATQITDCGKLQGMTMGQALELSKLPSGGHLLPVYDCVDGNYRPEVACSGYNSAAKGVEMDADGQGFYTCYADSKSKDFPLQRMFSYLNETSQAGPPSSGRAWSMQALWQESTDSVVIGELQGSSLLLDESRSELNKQLAAQVRAGIYPHVNLLEVNNVCDGGLELLEAIRALPLSSVMV